MNCEQVEELLSAYLDDALAPEERVDVAAHLQECSQCSSILVDFRRFDALLKQLPRDYQRIHPTNSSSSGSRQARYSWSPATGGDAGRPQHITETAITIISPEKTAVCDASNQAKAYLLGIACDASSYSCNNFTYACHWRPDWSQPLVATNQANNC